MGWTMSYDMSRADVIAERIQPWETDTHAGRTLRHCAKGNVLWTVREVTDKRSGTTERYIGCDLLGRARGCGWGYKDLCESMHPYYYTCPLAYLDMVPVACEKWRALVREHHARQQLRLRVGATYALIDCRIPHVEIESLRPLIGRYDGRFYRVSKSGVGAELPNDGRDGA